jgi:hypothetical protein
VDRASHRRVVERRREPAVDDNDRVVVSLARPGGDGDATIAYLLHVEVEEARDRRRRDFSLRDRPQGVDPVERGSGVRGGSAGDPTERPGWDRGKGGDGRAGDARPFQGGGSRYAGMGLSAILAGEAMARRVAQVGRRVPRHVRAKISTAGIVMRCGRLVRPAVIVHALDQHRGQDVKQRQPPTLPVHPGSSIRFMKCNKWLEKP